MDKTLSKTSAKQLLDYYLLNEVILNDNKRGFPARVKGVLAKNHSIRVTGTNVYQHYQGVLAGNPLRPSADVDGTPSIREGKDQNYAGIISLVDILLPKREMRRYVGLPANQLDVIASTISNSIVAVEYKPDKASKLKQFAQFVTQMRRNTRINVINDDIWSYLQTSEEKFNIFDLDLMCCLPKVSLKWAQAIWHSALPGVSVVHLTTTVGRKITVDSYETNVVRFTGNLNSVGFKSLGHSRFSYRDRVIPMRCERFVLKKETGEGK
jgi:hypothetical protein